MKPIPDFDIELAQASNYILGSDLAQKALEEPPFRNYTNIVRCILENVDRLADNCHMPEFTNHALPHICSIVKRASEWGVNDRWLEEICPKEAGYLLVALLIHDIGMLSQDVKDTPEQERMTYMKGFSDISNWVRRTHVLRIDGLVKRLLKDYIEQDDTLVEHLDVAVGMASSHAKWAWESNFVSRLPALRGQGLDEKRIAALNAVIAVSDLLDEDANRCDTVTLISHRHGSTENMAHWIRHAITVEVSEVKNHRIDIKMRKILPEKNHMDLVYRVLRNHYRLVKLYNTALSELNATIEKVAFDPGDGIPDLEDDISRKLTIWEQIPELKECLPQQLLQTFMAEALNQHCEDEKLCQRLNVIGLENVDLTDVQEFINPRTIVMMEEKVIRGDGSRKERYEYAHQEIEEAYLNGNIGKVRHLCMSVIENIDPGTSLDEVYWALIFSSVCMKSESDQYIPTYNYANVLRDDKYTKKQRKIVAKGSAYQQLLDVLFQIQAPMISEKWMNDYAKHLYKTKCGNLKDDLATRLLIQTVIGLFWFFAGEELWKEVADFFIKKMQKYIPSMAEDIAETKKRLLLQNEIMQFPDRVPEKELFEDSSQKEFAKSWIDFYAGDWKQVGEDAVHLVNAAKYNQDYCCSAQGYLNLTRESCKYNNPDYEATAYDDIYTGIYRYQRIVMEQPLPSFWNNRQGAIETLIAECRKSPLKCANERMQLLRLIVLRQLDALCYWNLGEYIESVRNFTMYDYLTGVYFDVKGNYCGIKENLPEIIIDAIRSLDDKIFEEEEQKQIVALLMEHFPEGLSKIIDYITERCPKLEWRYAVSWLQILAEHLDREQAQKILDWTLKYDEFVHKQRLYLNLKEYLYLQWFVEKDYLDAGYWRALEPIVFRLFQNEHMFLVNSGLCEAILIKAPKRQVLQYLKSITGYEENKWKHQTVYSICICLGSKREDLKKELHEFLAECRMRANSSLYENLDELIEAENLTALQSIDIDGLAEILRIDLQELEKNGVSGFDSRMLENTVDHFRNQNWMLAEDCKVQKVVNMLLAFLEKHNSELSVFYFGNICRVIYDVERMSSDAIRKNIVNWFYSHYIDESPKVVPPEKVFSDHPFNTVHMDLGTDGMYEQSVMMIVVTGMPQIEEITEQRKCILWSMAHTKSTVPVMYQYTTILCSYFYFMGTREIKDLAFAGLMLVQGSLRVEDEKWRERKQQVELAWKCLRQSTDWFGEKTFEMRVEEDEYRCQTETLFSREMDPCNAASESAQGKNQKATGLQREES